MEVKSIFITRFKGLYKERHLTQQGTADRLSVSVDTVKSWTSKKTVMPTLEHLLNICKEFDVDLGYLIGQQDFKKAASQRIHDLTGLGETTADSLQKLEEYEIEIINALFSDIGKLKKLLFLIDDYAWGHNATVAVFDEVLNKKSPLLRDSKSTLRYNALEAFGEIIDDMYQKNTAASTALRKAYLKKKASENQAD